MPIAAKPGDQYNAGGQIEPGKRQNLLTGPKKIHAPIPPPGVSASALTSQLGAPGDMAILDGFVFVLDSKSGQVERMRIGAGGAIGMRSLFAGGFKNASSVVIAKDNLLISDAYGVWQSPANAAFSAQKTLILPVRSGAVLTSKPLAYDMAQNRLYIGLNTDSGAHIASLDLATGQRASLPINAQSISALALTPGGGALWAGGIVEGRAAVFDVRNPVNTLAFAKGAQLTSLHFPNRNIANAPAQKTETETEWPSGLYIGLSSTDIKTAPPMIAVAGFAFGQIETAYTEFVQLPLSGPSAILSQNGTILFTDAKKGTLWRLTKPVPKPALPKAELPKAPVKPPTPQNAKPEDTKRPVIALPRGSGIGSASSLSSGSMIEADPLLRSTEKPNPETPEK